jgi:SAM-dependent methyltransferase
VSPRRGQNPFDSFARLYDWEHDPYVSDLDVHVAFARRFGGPVLELACGSGRLLAPLARAGFVVVGVDSSQAMLERARLRLERNGLQAQLIEQRLEALQLDSQFRTIVLGLDGFGLLLKREDQLRALRRVRQYATHDGRLILDVSNGNLRGAAEPAEELVHDLTEPDPDTGRPITKFVLRRPRPAEQIDDLLLFYDEQDENGYLRRTTVQLQLRWFTRFELELLLQSSGWQVEELYGNYQLEPYDARSDRILVVARTAAVHP